MAEISTGVTTLTNLDGLFKTVYGPSLKNLQPDGLILQDKIGFSERHRHGDKYQIPVLLAYEHGFTYAKTGAGAFALGGNVPGQTKAAEIQGSELVMQGALPYEAASRSVGGNKRAFLQASELLVTSMWESAKRRLEISMFYGSASIGRIHATTAPASGVVTLTDADFAPGIWSGMEGARLESTTTHQYPGNGTSVTKHAEIYIVDAVDIDAKTITVSLTTDPGVADEGALTVDDYLWFEGEYGATGVAGTYQNNMMGLHSILDTTELLFGIDPTEYSLWKAHEEDAGGTDLSFATVQKACATASSKGMTSDALLIIPAVTWANIMTDKAALRRFTGSDGGRSAYEIGAEKITFFTQTGKMEVVPSIYCKEGYAYLISPKDFDRIGSSDLTFERPGAEGKFFRDLSSNAGYEMRLWSDQALFNCAPGKCVLIHNIVNS